MGWIKRHFETVLAPVLVAGLYAALVLSAGAGTTAQVVAAMFFLVVLALWLSFRRLRVHAAASRLAAIGDPDGLLKLVERELPRRLVPATRTPLYIFRAMGHNLRGDWAEARRALDAADIKPGQRASRSWHLLWAAADIHTRTATGDAAGARVSYDKLVAPFRKLIPGAGVELIALECEARLALVDGDPAGARERIAPLVKDIRLGSAARGQLYALLAEAATAEGDDAAAAEHAAAARKLAPRCHLLADARPST